MPIKFYILCILTAISASFISIYSKEIVDKLLFPNKDIVYAIIIFCLAVAIFLSIFGVLLLTTTGRIQYLLFYSLLVFSLLFSIVFKYEYLEIIINPLLIFGSLAYIHYRYKQDISNQIKVKTNTISNHTFVFVLCLATLISINFYLLNYRGNSENLFQNVKNYLSNTSGYYVENLIGKNIATENTKIFGFDTSQFQIDPALLNQVKEQESSIKNNIKNQVTNQVNNVLDPYENYFNPVATGVIFLTIISLAPIAKYLTYLISSFLFWLLKRTKFINETTETIEVVRYRL